MFMLKLFIMGNKILYSTKREKTPWIQLYLITNILILLYSNILIYTSDFNQTALYKIILHKKVSFKCEMIKFNWNVEGLVAINAFTAGNIPLWISIYIEILTLAITACIIPIDQDSSSNPNWIQVNGQMLIPEYPAEQTLVHKYFASIPCTLLINIHV